MLADKSFFVDDDMGYLMHQIESMLAAVNAFAKVNDEKETPAET